MLGATYALTRTKKKKMNATEDVAVPLQPTPKLKPKRMNRSNQHQYSSEEIRALGNLFHNELFPKKRKRLCSDHPDPTNDPDMITVKELCDHCQGPMVFCEEGVMTCSDCGVLYTDVVEQGAEWRHFPDDGGSDPARCGMPVNSLLEESSYGCKVLYKGGPLSPQMIRIMHMTQWISLKHREKVQYDSMQYINLISQNAFIPKCIIDDAVTNYKRISEHHQKHLRGQNREGILAASVYLACRQHNCPRTAKELSRMFQIDWKSATKGCKLATSILNDLEQTLAQEDKLHLARNTPEQFIERFCSKLCVFVASRLSGVPAVMENAPQSMAAAIVYYVIHMLQLKNIKKQDVTRVAETSEVTLNKCFKKIVMLSQTLALIPSMVLQKYGVNV